MSQFDAEQRHTNIQPPLRHKVTFLCLFLVLGIQFLHLNAVPHFLSQMDRCETETGQMDCSPWSNSREARLYEWLRTGATEKGEGWEQACQRGRRTQDPYLLYWFYLETSIHCVAQAALEPAILPLWAPSGGITGILCHNSLFFSF